MKKSYESVDGWKWWQEAWYDTQGAKVEFFITGLISIVASLLIGRLPLLRSFASHALTPFLIWGFFEFSRQWRVNKVKNFQALLLPFQDKATAIKLLQLSVVGFAFGVLYLLCNWLADRSMWFGTLRFAVGLIEVSAFLFAVPLVALGKAEPVPALRMSLETVAQNAPVFAVFYAIMILSSLVSLATLGVGFLFLLPLYVYFPYFLYTKFYS